MKLDSTLLIKSKFVYIASDEEGEDNLDGILYIPFGLNDSNFSYSYSQKNFRNII